MPRLFFALQPTPAQSAALTEAVAPLVKELDGQPVPATNLHVTLCFIGAVDEEKVARLREVASQVRGRALTLAFDALDYWDKPEILCATAVENIIARDLSCALSDAACGAELAPDPKPFRAHLTLARKVRRRVAEKFQWPRALGELRVSCEHFVLMESRRNDSGSSYSVVESWPLDEK